MVMFSFSTYTLDKIGKGYGFRPGVWIHLLGAVPVHSQIAPFFLILSMSVADLGGPVPDVLGFATSNKDFFSVQICGTLSGRGHSLRIWPFS